MLVLERKENQRIKIGKDIWVEVLNSNGAPIKLGITAPTEVPIAREEILTNLQTQ